MDAVDLTQEAKAQLDRLTRNGKDIAAVLMLHSFHTLFLPVFHQLYPSDTIRYYGCPRHLAKYPDINWAGDLNYPSVRSQFAPEIELSIPKGQNSCS
jgi:hypothetical protein